jgi:NAD(P)-dependent dehydrogenase (short-subunit alcohol dehydrogenase family)
VRRRAGRGVTLGRAASRCAGCRLRSPSPEAQHTWVRWSARFAQPKPLRQIGDLDAKAAIATIVAKFGRLDILVANAGGHGVGPTIETTDDSWQLAKRLNLDTAFVCARHSLPALIASRGNIFSANSHLSRQFRERFQMTPREMRFPVAV